MFFIYLEASSRCTEFTKVAINIIFSFSGRLEAEWREIAVGRGYGAQATLSIEKLVIFCFLSYQKSYFFY